MFYNFKGVYMSSTVFSNRKYNLSNSDLAIFANSLVFVMNRDLTEFENYGVTSDSISNLEDLINEFQAMPDDEIQRSEISEAVEARDSLRNSVLNTMRSLSVRGKAVFGEKSAKYRSLSPGSISQMTENDLLASARQVHTSAENNLSGLESEGVTQDYLDNFNSTIDDYENAINDVNNKKILRDDATELKVIKGNELYGFVVKYCDYGKLIWGGVSDSKYNDYVIYSAGTGGGSGGGTNPNAPAAPTNFRYDYAEVSIKWDAVNGATSYQVEFSEDNTNWEVIYDGPDTEFVTNPMLAEHTFLRARARNANGFSNFTSVVNIVYDLTLPMAQNLTYLPAYPGFNWDVVPGAINYEVHLRNQSAPPDEWLRIYFGNDNTLYHADPIGSYAYRIRAWNNQGTSAWAELEYSVTP